MLDEVNITVHRDRSQGHADLVLRWKGATLSELTTPPCASHQRSAPMRTPSAGRRLTAHYPDAKIAWILNWQGRRPAWHGREIPSEPARWPMIADGAPTPHQYAEARDLLAALREDSGSRLTAHEREVLVAIALSDVPIDVLAERLNTTRGALYKTPHDARRKLRAALAARGLGIDGDERGEEP